MTPKIKQLLSDLHLGGMLQALDEQLAQAQQQATATETVLYRLLCAEHAYRQQRSMRYRIQKAKIPVDWTLSTFPFQRTHFGRFGDNCLAGDFFRWQNGNPVVLTVDG